MLDKKEIKQASSRCSFSPNTTVWFFFNVAIPDVVSHRGQVWTSLLPPDVFLWFQESSFCASDTEGDTGKPDSYRKQGKELES